MNPYDDGFDQPEGESRATGRASVRPVSPSIPSGPIPGGPIGPGGPMGPGGPGGRGPYDGDGYDDFGDDEFGDGFGDGLGDEGAARGRARVRKDGKGAPRSEKSKKARRRNIIIASFAVFIMLAGVGVVGGTYYVDGIPTPDQLTLPEATTVYYRDGKTIMARLGEENRTIVPPEEMVDSIKQAIVAAEDQTFWTNEGVDFAGVLRAAWNNFTGGETQGASTLTQQYARMAMDLKGATYSRKLREAVIAWKLDDKYSKNDILGFYLNTVPFGRGTHGVEAAAQAFFGKSVKKTAPTAQQLTVSEAMLMVAFVKQPEPNPDDPDGEPGFDPTRADTPAQAANSLANAKGRWGYVRDSMVKLKYLSQADADKLVFPTTVKKYDPKASASNLDTPAGLIVQQALAELRKAPQFKGKPKGYIENGGFKIITTVDAKAQQFAIEAADFSNPKAPSIDRNQPADWRSALVAVEPGTGRVLAYYGGKNNTGGGADYASWYLDENNDPVGFGFHPSGSTFKVYDLLAALKAGISLNSYWPSPPLTKEFPEADRVKGKLGPIHNAGPTKCTPVCPLYEAAAQSLNIPFFDLTLHLGAANVLATARDAGIDFMKDGKANRHDLRTADIGAEMVPNFFGNELGIGQYGITVLDHANGMATVAAGGKRAEAHFVQSVLQHDKPVYSEKLGVVKDLGLTQGQIGDLQAALKRVSTSVVNSNDRFTLPQTWDVASKTGTWEWKDTSDFNAHVWVVGFTNTIAVAGWLGTESGSYLNPKHGYSAHEVFGNNFVGPFWHQFMQNTVTALWPKADASMRKFGPPGKTGNLLPAGAVASPTPTPTPPPTEPTNGPGGPGGPGRPPTPTPTATPTKSPKPNPTKTGH